jgi:phosphocarrier protein
VPHRIVSVASPNGIHARVAAEFVRRATASAIHVTLSRVDEPAVDASSIVAVLTLDVKHGEKVAVYAFGENDEQVVARLAAFLATATDESLARG